MKIQLILMNRFSSIITRPPDYITQGQNDVSLVVKFEPFNNGMWA